MDDVSFQQQMIGLDDFTDKTKIGPVSWTELFIIIGIDKARKIVIK